MKTITIYTACVANGGSRIEAGSNVMVGDEKEDISKDRAIDLVEKGLAVDPYAEAKARNKAEAKGLAQANAAAGGDEAKG